MRRTTHRLKKSFRKKLKEGINYQEKIKLMSFLKIIFMKNQLILPWIRLIIFLFMTLMNKTMRNKKAIK